MQYLVRYCQQHKTFLALFFAIGFLTPHFSLYAEEIYKTTDENGNTVFTDSPQGKKAEKVELKTLNTQPPTKRIPVLTHQERKKRIMRYAIAITTPKPGTTLNPGDRNLSITAAITPNFRQGHRAIILLNGQQYGEPQTYPEFTINNVPRGQHSLVVAVISSDGKIISRSRQVTIYAIRPIIKK